MLNNINEGVKIETLTAKISKNYYFFLFKTKINFYTYF